MKDDDKGKLSLVGESITQFMEKNGINDKEVFCINCNKKAIWNKCFYLMGHAIVRFEHDCPKRFWVSRMVPISEKEKSFWEGIT